MTRSRGISTPCPKCGHVRRPDEHAPAWQCPACGIAYHKYQAYLQRARQAVTPPGSSDVAPPVNADGSMWMLGLSNVAALMFVPYLRIVPMHLTIVFGISRAHSTVGLLFFGGLKTVADMAMHYVEHARLQRRLTL